MCLLHLLLLIAGTQLQKEPAVASRLPLACWIVHAGQWIGQDKIGQSDPAKILEVSSLAALQPHISRRVPVSILIISLAVVILNFFVARPPTSTHHIQCTLVAAARRPSSRCRNVSFQLRFNCNNLFAHIHSLLRLLRCLPHARLHERAQGPQQRPQPSAQRHRLLPT